MLNPGVDTLRTASAERNGCIIKYPLKACAQFGVSSTIHPIAVNLASVLDLAIMIVVSIITFLFAKSGKLGRPAGAAMVALYAADVVFAILR